ncbi:glycosyltransferase family 2 protein [Pedobacter boryungensis]|uniref:Glycosyltransferase n=1 Tax=Pedobacter boryungensis TaxID=869962 RepID=A0ABX2DCD8_9SPHI|nr:glycosyltransferase [Pedobacter boryungensis]NQX31730.1 glycosyltransferase [Pedobacter boryungensis]
MDKPLVSIIIPTFNYGELISQTLQCALEQSYSNWEAIIIDDGSTDNTIDIIQPFLTDKRFIYHKQKNKGLPAARNKGISIAKGDYIQFLDADDLLSKEKLTVQVDYMQKHEQLHISYTNGLYFKGYNINETYANRRMTQTDWIPKLNNRGIDVIMELLKRNIMPVNAALLKREVFNIVGLQNDTLKSLEDWEFWLRCAFENLYFGYCDNTNSIALIRLHSESMSIDKTRMMTQELVLRDKIDLMIQNSKLVTDRQKNTLTTLNKKKKAYSYRRIILSKGFFNAQLIKEIYAKYGFSILVTIYAKALNDLRKQKSKF